MFKSKSKRFMEGRDLIPCPWQSERFLDSSDAPEIIADSANLKIVGDMTAGRESGREKHQKPAKTTAVDVGTDAFHQHQGFGSYAVSQPMLQLWPRIVIQIDWQILNIIEAPPPLRRLLLGVDSFWLIAFQDLDAPAA